MRLRVAAGLIALQAAGTYLAFPSALLPAGHPATAWLVFLTPVPFYWLVLAYRGRAAFLQGGASGAAMFLPAAWYLTRMSYFGWTGPLLWLTAVFLTWAWTGAAAWMIAAVRARRPGYFVWFAPAALVVFDVTRVAASPWLWLVPPPAAMLAYPLALYPDLLQMVSLTGVLGLVWLVNAAAAAAAWWTWPWVSARLGGARVVREPGERRAALRIAAGMALAVVLLAAGGQWDAAMTRKEQDTAPKLRVALLQPDFDAAIIPEWKESVQVQALDMYRQMVLDASRRGADLVVFPEDAITGLLPRDLRTWNGYRSIFEEAGVWAVLGFITRVPPDRSYNAFYWLSPDGRIHGYYLKQYLVPFGEYLPWRPLWTLMERLVRILGAQHLRFLKLTALEHDTNDLTPGRETVVFRQGDDRAFFIAICDELLFPGYFRAGVRRGGQAILMPATGNWFQTPDYFWHFMRAAQIRAVECRRWAGRTVNTTSAYFIDAWGRLQEYTPLGERAVAVQAMPLLKRRTLYVQWGDWPGWLALVLVVAGLGLSIGPRRPLERG